MVASAAKSLLIKTCSDKNAANAKVCLGLLEPMT